ncbi:OmpA family protein [Deminuibacter soli]|uniref:Flagellar motor protein MotB n=1 Tax=Deminuibacter soli TaxID=2291815 RepID=A0A3E1NDN9_9BACT|nr:OmpA family protein [Deminuibacter soli]RFM25982.1 flagellar motor protein MotB [Deminuibacter soli]
MKNIFLAVSILFCAASAMAQNGQKPVNKKSLEAYEKAMLQLRDGLVKDAIPLLGKAIEYDPAYIEPYLSMAGVYGELKEYQKSVDYYEKARSLDSTYFKYYCLPYSINLAGLGRFEDALHATDSFLSIPNLNEKSVRGGRSARHCYEFAIDYAQTHPATGYVFQPVNMGDSINSPQAEYYPSFTINDSVFVFTRRGQGIREDFMQSLKTPAGYTKASVINGSINNEPSKGAINISQDGEWLIFAGNFGNKGFGNFDLYISYNTPNGWSEPVNLGGNINTEYWESSPSLSSDKNALYFSSDRPGGYGGNDLYVSYRQPNGKWSPAVNMGPTINTRGDELAPFVHADNQTLYYTSSGLPGYGGTDLYVLRKDSSLNWGKPENLGYPINTIENEGSLFVASDGVTAYYASDRADTRGQLDLYKFDLRPDIRPARTLYVQGYVTDADTHKGIPCTVELTDNVSRKALTRLQTDETGFYFVTLPGGKDYTFTVNRKGYLFYSDLYILSNKTPDSTYKKDIALQPIRLNAGLTFRNIQFATNSFQLEPVSTIELDKLVQLLGDNPTLKVQISGYTDNTGNAADNLKLSANRAKSVVDYLVSKGIAVTRLSSKGYGATMPVASNATEEGKAQNRRTTFTITGL